MIKICVGYQINGKRYQYLPSLAEDIEKCVPIYDTMPGWKTPISEITRPEDLPQRAKDYLKRIESLCGIPISMISVGPERDRTIILTDLFSAKDKAS